MKPVVFAIPLVSRTDPASWQVVNTSLSYTLRSILRQTDPAFTVLIACHDRPECEEMFDPRVVFLEARGERVTAPDQFVADKSRKRRQLAQAVKAAGGGYMVLQDGDDIIHRRLVEYFRKADAPHGYTYPTGFVMDMQTRHIAAVPGVWHKPFSHVCGSSAAIWFNPADFDPPPPPAGAPPDQPPEESYFRRFKQHALWAEVAQNAGRPLAEVPFPCCIYAQNSGQNISAVLRRQDGRLQRLLRSIEQAAIPITPEFAVDFSLDWIWRPAPARKRRRPEVLIGAPATEAARIAAHQIDTQRLAAAEHLPADPAENARRRRSGAGHLAGVVAKVVTALRPATILEIGAHEAGFSQRMKRALPDSRVVAFEANPEVHARHRAVLDAAGVEYLMTCMADTEGERTFNIPVRRTRVKATMGSVLEDSEAEDHIRYRVPGVTLDGFLGADQGAVALWIDVEGAMGQVLAGGAATLRRCVALFAELETTARWPGQTLAHEVLPAITQAGLVPLLADTQREWQFNVLFVRPAVLADPAITDIVRGYFARTAA